MMFSPLDWTGFNLRAMGPQERSLKRTGVRSGLPFQSVRFTFYRHGGSAQLLAERPQHFITAPNCGVCDARRIDLCQCCGDKITLATLPIQTVCFDLAAAKC